MQFTESHAIYLQITKVMEEKILAKEWLVEMRTLSVRELAASMKVNPNTAIKAYEILQQKKVIYNKRGIGYFVSENAYSLVKKEWRQNFKTQELPQFFKNIALLGFSMNEIEVLYKQHQEKIQH